MPTASDTADLVPLALIQSTCAEDPSENLAKAEDRIERAARDLAVVERARRDWPFLRDRRIDAYGDFGRRFRD